MPPTGMVMSVNQPNDAEEVQHATEIDAEDGQAWMLPSSSWQPSATATSPAVKRDRGSDRR